MDQAQTAKPAGRPHLPEWELEVMRAEDLTPRMRRVVVTGPALPDFAYEPGQSVILRIPGAEDGRREYTIRSLDRERGEMALDFVLHGTTPGPEWARQVRAGERFRCRGPRGRTVFRPRADWHLFIGDETCIPAILHILEEAPRGTRAIALIEVEDAADELPVETEADLELHWLHRDGVGQRVLDRLEALDLPAGHGHAYVIGETGKVRAQRHHLLARGLAREQISSEGYWRPGRVGGHDHVED
jgi:NADPH-dependent ferric siderophore reductase